MIAGLPMYDLPSLQWATDALWQLLSKAMREEGVPDVPEHLMRPEDIPAFWRDPALLFGQTCGYPLVTMLAGQVRVVATPVYAAAGCEGQLYRSHIIVRVDERRDSLSDFLGGRAAINGWDSHSGMNALRHSFAALSLGREACFSEVRVSGGHRSSMTMVAEGEADLAAIDCVTYALITASEPDLGRGLRVLASSRPAPGLPFITHGRADDALIAHLTAALHSALADPAGAEARAALLLSGVVDTNEDDYQVILEMEREAAALGYAELR